MININNIGGAGGMRPIIRITSQAGSTLTCGSQTYTLGASETVHDFTVSVSATAYTCTATLGTESATDSVLVDATEIYEVTLAYSSWLKLYWDGDECTSVTGGWNGMASRWNGLNNALAPTVSKNSDSFYAYLPSTSGGANRGIVSPANAVDVTNYTTAKIHVELAEALDSYSAGVLYLMIANTNVDGHTPLAFSEVLTTVASQVTTQDNYTISLDISSYTGSKYIFIDFFAGNYSQDYTSITVDRVWLE